MDDINTNAKQKDDGAEPEFLEAIKQTDQGRQPIEDSADAEELIQCQDAVTDEYCAEGEDDEFDENYEEDDQDEEEEVSALENNLDADEAYLMEELQESFEDGVLNEEEWLIIQECSDNGECWARSTDAGWYYEN